MRANGHQFGKLGTFLLCVLWLQTGLLLGGVQPVWVRRYNAGPAIGTNKPVAIALDIVGNIVLAGSASRGGTSDYIVLKYASEGTLLWDIPYSSPSNRVDEVRALRVDAAGSVYVTGSSATIRYDGFGNTMWVAPYGGCALAVDGFGNTYVAGFETNDFATVKLSPEGSNSWLRMYAGPGGRSDIAEAISVDGENNVYVAGEEVYFVDSKGGEQRHFAIVKYNPAGDQQWVRGFPAGSYTSYPGKPMRVLGLINAGSSVYVSGNLRGTPGQTFYTHKFLDNGDTAWAYHHLNHDEGVAAVVVDESQSVYLTGNRPFVYADDTKYETIKLNSAGQAQWISYYGADTGYHRANAIALDSSKNVYVTGQSPEPGMGTNFVTIKYSPSGQERWVKRYNGDFNGDDVATAIAVDTNSGAIYVTGYSQASSNLTEIVLIKYAELQNIQVQTNGHVFLQFFGNPGQNYAIHCTTNFQSWTNLATVTANTNGIYSFTDTNAPADPQRFYKTSGP